MNTNLTLFPITRTTLEGMVHFGMIRKHTHSSGDTYEYTDNEGKDRFIMFWHHGQPRSTSYYDCRNITQAAFAYIERMQWSCVFDGSTWTVGAPFRGEFSGWFFNGMANNLPEATLKARRALEKDHYTR